jgi:hypothetical protein
MTTKVNDMRGTRIITGLVPALYDRVDVEYSSPTVTVYTFSLDGVSLGAVTIVTDSQGNMLSAERTS